MAEKFWFMLTLTLTLAYFMVAMVTGQDPPVRFTVWEGRPNRTYIGSVALQSGLFVNATSDEMQNLHFQILIEGNLVAAMFSIDHVTSVLRTNRELDREQFDDCHVSCVLQFSVAVYRNLRDLLQILPIHVTLEDVNDNSPEFLKDEEYVDILESESPGFLVLADYAEDADRGEGNSVQTYQLLPSSDVFQLDVVRSEGRSPEFAIKLKKSLDRETVDFYQFTVLAIDGGQPQNTASMTVYVTVVDVNDNKPAFGKPLYNTTLQENPSVGSVVTTVSATDEDDGENGEVRFQLSRSVSNKIEQLFKVNATTGEITVSGKVDYESDKAFGFTVEAHDRGNPSSFSQAKVYIKVTDVNDNYPNININIPLGGAVLSEKVDAGTFVTHLEVTDLDAGENGKIQCNVSDKHFKLQPVLPVNNFKLVLNQKLDHDTASRHTVKISCRDNGDPVRHNSSIIVVHVDDINDNTPLFDRDIYMAELEENNDKVSFVLKVTARDRDSGDNGDVRYSLHPEVDQLFSIDEHTGAISTNHSIDRETHPEVIFRVLATDRGQPARTSTGTVVVTILDQNDNDPTFTPGTIELYVTENELAGTEVGNITVRDPDNGENGTFVLFFPADENVLEHFKFEPDGRILTVRPLDRESIAVHDFYVSASDMGGRTSSALVTVTVGDQNDNIPAIFYPNNYNSRESVPYTLPVGSVVAAVDARDPDLGDNARLSYYIDQDNSSHLFLMTEDTGEILLDSAMQAEEVDVTYSLVIRVRDHGDPFLTSWAKLHIVVAEGETPAGSRDGGKIQPNVWIVVAVVLLTLVLSVVMVVVICKVCWYDRRKFSDRTSEIIMESDTVNPKLIESSSAGSESLDDSMEKKMDQLADVSIQRDDTSVFNTTFSSDDKHAMEKMYLQKTPDSELGFSYGKSDEATSDNSAELETRDSGQGGSDIDLNSLSEQQDLDTPDQQPYQRSRNHDGTSLRDCYYGDDVLNSGCHSNTTGETMCAPSKVANFTITPFKTAERREINKLRKVPKRVMFSDDLENSQSSTSSSGLTFSYSDINKMADGHLAPARQFSRQCSEDPSRTSRDFTRPNNNLRRSLDNLPLLSGLYPSNKTLPSNHVLSGNSSFKPGVGEKMRLDSGHYSSSSEGDRNSVEVYSLSTKSSGSREDTRSSTSGSYSLTLDESWAGMPAGVYDKDVFV